ncbi:MAG: UDP-3-O-acylglucosamine N-acyltransferase [Bacteroidia bacterium]|nr:MAG: UDP-3-O-acylglucosamine N-acyltransferase [Bacteroidia bacterium]
MLLKSIEIAEMYKGEIFGDSNVEIYSLCTIEDGKTNGLAFLANPKYIPYLYDTQASAVLISKDFVIEKPVSTTLIKVDNPYAVFTDILNRFFYKKIENKGISDKSEIDETAVIGENVFIDSFVRISKGVVIKDNVKIFANCFIGENCVIEEGTIIFANVSIYDHTKIGKNCIIHSGTTIGADGFGFAPQKDGTFMKIPQIGNVVIHDNVEIGANSCIDRATLGSTVIHSGVKIDNLVQIAHNCVIGENTVLAAQSGVSGSTKIGKNCMIGGQVGIVGHIVIADGTQIGAQSGVSKTVKNKGSILRGSPAQNIKTQLKQEALIRQLPELYQKIQELENQLKSLQNS